MTIEQEFLVKAPPARVFAYVTDPAKLPEWQPTAISVTNESGGPIRAGTRLREVRRGPFGKRLEQLVEVSEYEADRAFGLRIVDGPLKVDGRYVFEESGDGTCVKFRAEGRAPRLLKPLLARQFARYHRRLRDQAAEPVTSASANGVRT